MTNNERKVEISLVILVYNGLRCMEELFTSIRKQSIQPELIVIDSESSDGTREWLTKKGIGFTGIEKSDFNHGSTRNLGMELATNDLVSFVTQDVIFDNSNSLELLVKPLIEDESVAMAFGRQLPHQDATTLSTFARLHNYPPETIIKSKADSERLGIKTPWISNSFSVYKKTILTSLGRFPSHLIMCEDVFVGAKGILAGYKIAYVGEARVFHSHNYTLSEEFKRYFDIGYFYNSERWILENFKNAEGEGFSYVRKEITHVFSKRKPWLVIEIGIRTVMKYMGYQLGKYPYILPYRIKKMLSMHSYYWNLK